ncbi:hypothetical protein DFA_02264 [Cavenderia fasciculata]|uniref:Transmembrane protein n=1 Tax=Cavenderia fasciculata TaxID=261658 RepID=F4PYZ2_CACFS|nr:uncharacterized protein DFA_02264 [Cavenderia fasciculata]EGG19021.1 hypothetical protein DFA_02264 [Cavenderia fasciculata]|eukprot:XP_004366654.1 hypothetical protein DFA_02264 [Cavenderia fasciculata]
MTACFVITKLKGCGIIDIVDQLSKMNRENLKHIFKDRLGLVINSNLDDIKLTENERNQLLPIDITMSVESFRWNSVQPGDKKASNSGGGGGTASNIVMHDDLSQMDSIGIFKNFSNIESAQLGTTLECDRFHRSAKLLLISWITSFTLPFLINILPIAALIFHNAPPLNDDAVPSFEYITSIISVRLLFAIESYMKLSPAVLAILPALAKGCTSIKTLLPQSPVLGFLIKGLRLISVPIMLGPIIFFYQIVCDFIVFVAIILFIVANMVFIIVPFKGLNITKPFKSGKEVAERLKTISRISMAFYILAGLCLIGYFLNLAFTFIGQDRLARIKWSSLTNFIPFPNPVSLAKFVFDFLVKYFIASVTFCDLMLWILQKIHIYTRDYQDLMGTYNDVMENSLYKVMPKTKKSSTRQMVEIK